MDAETREHIFEPFFTTKERGKGTGLGLATIYGIVGQAGGHIWVYSEPNRGSVFKLYFPRVDAAASEQSLVEPLEPTHTHGTVLIVEDDPQVRDLTTQLLERAGYTVVAAQDAATALEVFDRLENIDALVTDVVMPGISGIELAEGILERIPNLAIVLLSGYTAETLGVDRLNARDVEFVSKPVANRELLRAVGSAITRSRERPRER